MGEQSDQAPAAPTCSRCRRVPRDAEDEVAWVEIDGEEVCPGCMTLRDQEQLRSDSPPGGQY